MNNEKLIMKNYGVALRATDFTTHPVGKADTPPQGRGNTSPSASYPRPKKVAWAQFDEVGEAEGATNWVARSATQFSVSASYKSQKLVETGCIFAKANMQVAPAI